MQGVQILLIACFVLLGLIGFYFQLQAQSYLKKNRISSMFTKAWIFHPEYLEEPGLVYRKKLIICWAVAASLILAIVLID